MCLQLAVKELGCPDMSSTYLSPFRLPSQSQIYWCRDRVYWASTYSLLLFLCCLWNLYSNFEIVRVNRYLSAVGQWSVPYVESHRHSCLPHQQRAEKLRIGSRIPQERFSYHWGNETTFKFQNQDCLSKEYYMGVREWRIRVGELFLLYSVSFHFLVFSYLAPAGSQREAPKSQWWCFRVQ